MRMLMMAGIAMISGLATTPGAAAQDAAGAPKLLLSAPLTHSDWMLRDGVVWGAEGVHHMLDQCKAAGWTRVYWRALDGGRSLYKSSLMDPQGKWDEDNFWNPSDPEDRKLMESYTAGMTPESRKALLEKLERFDYGSFDTLAEAVTYGHQIGIEVHAWISINEDDHGWGLRSRFAKAHPECRWRKRDGTFYHTQQSFAFPEVMRYKLAIVDELLRQYAIDGIFVDWLRTGDVRDNPQNDKEGVADRGYEEPLLTGFKAKYGIDPYSLPNGDDRWVRFRAEPHTEFMRGVRQRAQAKRPGMPIAALVVHPWAYRGMQDKIDGNLRGMLLDVAAWAREGLVDAVVPAGYYMGGGNSEKAYTALREETGGKTDVWFYGWVPGSVADFDRDFGLAQRLGAKQILFWEADYIDARPNREELQNAMRARAADLKR